MNNFFHPFRRFSVYIPLKSFFLLMGCIVIHTHGQINAKISPTAKESITAQCLTSNVKVVFIYKDTMCFVDFSENSPQIHKMNNVTSAYFPVISSDGKWITYQTGVEAEGFSASTKVATAWIRELAINGTPVKIADTAYVPRFVQNTPVDSPEIIYSTSVACPNNICYNNGRTLKKKIVQKFPQSAQVVYEKGSYYGGLSWEGRFLITGWPGGPNVFMFDLQDTLSAPHAVHTMRVKKNITNVDTFVAIGACNISRSASSVFTNTTLYYDFSSMAIKSAGCYHPLLGSWATHEKLFISRYDGEDLKVFDTPADRPLVSIADAQGTGEAVGKEWYNPEWSNHPYYAAASLLIDRLYNVNSSWENTYNCESVYLVDLKDSSYIKLIESTDSSYTSKTNFSYPFLWVEKSSNFQEDTTWLKQTIWERAGLGVRYYNKNLKSFKGRNTIIEGKDITAIVLYSLTGRKIYTLKCAGKSSINLDIAFKNIHPGGYCIGIESKSAKKQFIHWFVEKK
jgi:hypothetical protein